MSASEVRIFGDKKGGGREAVEADDTLRSRAFARVLDLICEGEIEGLVDGAKSIYLDGTRLQASDGTFNFQGVTVDFRPGTQGQTPIDGFPAVESETYLGVKVVKDTPLTRTFTNPNVDAFRVKILLPQLYQQDKKTGDVNGASVRFKIEIQGAGSTAWTVVADEEINGKTMGQYERQYRVEPVGSAPWSIRVTRLSDDSTSGALKNELYVSSITEVIETKLSYPNSALVGIRIDASQFSQVPQRSYHMRLLKVRVPSNYDPVSRTYSGVWNGEFKIAWTNNPAWCFYDLLTNERYGLGRNIDEALIDKWALYQIGRYCDEPVPDGRGGTEPRFALNAYIQSRQEAFRVLGDMASAFRGMLYWASGSVFASVDAPGDPVYLYTNANVINGEFSYSGSSLKQRHTVALVSWNDINDLGRTKVEYVSDEDGIAKFGIVETEITAFGCTSQAQAHRVGRWMLLSELTETEVVVFSTGLEGAVARPGQIIRIRDGYRSGSRVAGRVEQVLGSSRIRLDAPLQDAGVGAQLFINTTHGVHSATISSLSADRTEVTFAPATTDEIAPDAVWMTHVGSDVREQDYRVISVAEKGDGVYEITALEHNRQKFSAIDTGTKIDDGGPGGPNPNPGVDGILPPKNVRASVVSYTSGTTQKFKIILSWEPGKDETLWNIRYSHNSGSLQSANGVNINTFEVDDAQAGYWLLGVQAVAGDGKTSTFVYAPAVFVGTRGLSDVFDNLVAIPNFEAIRLEWEYKSDEVVASLDKVEIWGYEVAVESEPYLLGTVAAANTAWRHEGLMADQTWRYYVRAIDQYGNASPLFPSGGVTATALVDVTKLVEDISNDIINSEIFRDIGSAIDVRNNPAVVALQEYAGPDGRLQQEIDRILSTLNRDGEILLRNVLVNEQIRQEGRDAEARIMQAVQIVEDGLALEASAREEIASRVGAVEADIVTERLARSDGDSALAAQIQALEATLNDTVQAQIVTERQVRANADSALASQINALDARVTTETGQLQALIATEEQARVDGDGALSSRIDVLGAQFASDLAVVNAAVASEQEARASADAALASAVDSVGARLNNFNPDGGQGGSLEAFVANERTARIEGDSANAQAITQVSARLNNVGGEGSGVTIEQKFSATANELEGLKAQYSVKIDNNGYVSGFGLSSTPVNSTPVSSFVVRADKFAIGSPSGPGIAPLVPFTVFTSPQTVNGYTVNPGVYINGDALVNGSVTALKIDSRGLMIRDNAGNVILGAGNPLNIANISGLGALATQNTVRLGTNVTFPDGSVVNSYDLVTRLNKIDSSNIGTFITSAAIGGAYIGNAEIGTLKIQGQAVTVPGGSNGVYSASVTLTTDVPTNFMVIGTFTQGEGKNQHAWHLRHNGFSHQREIPFSGTLGAMSRIFYVGAGTHTFTIDCETQSGDGACGITVVGVKR